MQPNECECEDTHLNIIQYIAQTLEFYLFNDAFYFVICYYIFICTVYVFICTYFAFCNNHMGLFFMRHNQHKYTSILFLLLTIFSIFNHCYLFLHTKNFTYILKKSYFNLRIGCSSILRN